MSPFKHNHDAISYLSPNTVLDGHIHANGDVHIDGTFSGSVTCNGDVIIGKGSKVTGEIKAKNVLISGHFKGNVHAVELLEIFASGQIEGDIQGSRLTIHEGGMYKGKVNMDVIHSSSLYEGSFQLPQ